MKSNSTIEHWFPTPCLMIHCLSNIEEKLEGAYAGPIASAALQSCCSGAPPWDIRWISFNQTKRFCQPQQWHRPNSFPVNYWCIWCAPFSAKGKSYPSTNYLEVTRLIPLQLNSTDIMYNHKPCFQLCCTYDSLRRAMQYSIFSF